jgi:3-hydroxyisobutyrate dehydrogenase-like beta-hydroxyacid dehydrogenase
MNEAEPRIGFIGLGAMGSRLAKRLQDAGYPLIVYNRTRQKTEPFQRAGVAVAESPRDAARHSDLLMSSVADDRALKQVMFGPDGALAGVHAGHILIDLSSVYPETSIMMAEAAAGANATFLDAAISGTTTAVEQGEVMILVGGDRHTFERCRAILRNFGKLIEYMGPAGSGTTTKLVINTLLGVEMQAIAEAIALGEKAGLDRTWLISVLEKSVLIPAGLKAKLDNARHNRYPTSFALRLMHKDFGNILRKASKLNVPMPATAAAEQICSFENAKGLEEDFSAVIRAMEELALELQPTQPIEGEAA